MAVNRYNTGLSKVHKGGSELSKIYKGNTEIYSAFNVYSSDAANASARNIKLANPGAGSGVYSIQPNTTKPAFNAYCDMTTDGGGWTLVMANSGDLEIGNTDPFWDGAGTINHNFSYGGSTFNTLNMTTILQSMKFTEIRIKWGTQEEVHISTDYSSFANKKYKNIPWNNNGNGTMTWNAVDNDGYSRGDFVLGYRGAAAGYGDYNWFFIGGTSYGYTYFGHQFQYASFTDNCAGLGADRCGNSAYRRSHVIGSQGHRYSNQTNDDYIWLR